jgi:hypothetical protein
MISLIGRSPQTRLKMKPCRTSSESPSLARRSLTSNKSLGCWRSRAARILPPYNTHPQTELGRRGSRRVVRSDAFCAPGLLPVGFFTNNHHKTELVVDTSLVDRVQVIKCNLQMTLRAASGWFPTHIGLLVLCRPSSSRMGSCQAMGLRAGRSDDVNTSAGTLKRTR